MESDVLTVPTTPTNPQISYIPEDWLTTTKYNMDTHTHTTVLRFYGPLGLCLGLPG